MSSNNSTHHSSDIPSLNLRNEQRLIVRLRSASGGDSSLIIQEIKYVYGNRIPNSWKDDYACDALLHLLYSARTVKGEQYSVLIQALHSILSSNRINLSLECISDLCSAIPYMCAAAWQDPLEDVPVLDTGYPDLNNTSFDLRTTYISLLEVIKKILICYKAYPETMDGVDLPGRLIEADIIGFLFYCISTVPRALDTTMSVYYLLREGAEDDWIAQIKFLAQLYSAGGNELLQDIGHRMKNSVHDYLFHPESRLRHLFSVMLGDLVFASSEIASLVALPSIIHFIMTNLWQSVREGEFGSVWPNANSSVLQIAIILALNLEPRHKGPYCAKLIVKLGFLPLVGKMLFSGCSPSTNAHWGFAEIVKQGLEARSQRVIKTIRVSWLVILDALCQRFVSDTSIDAQAACSAIVLWREMGEAIGLNEDECPGSFVQTSSVNFFALLAFALAAGKAYTVVKIAKLGTGQFIRQNVKKMLSQCKARGRRVLAYTAPNLFIHD
ncbi:hypothetical protein FRC02_006885 [Tulasnella sp. 418]|nr:hypothetical protein FRC02_006885 [Tulasnella sp. 418]